uniref:cuticle collagen 2C-like n=1 Tax=Ictidomys tridecemlineatus TaxID=43179 RepID=UPI001A9DCF4F|nr:cuticle collagen 2C-like [Ictidomys tridecemlineatus]
MHQLGVFWFLFKVFLLNSVQGLLQLSRLRPSPSISQFGPFPHTKARAASGVFFTPAIEGGDSGGVGSQLTQGRSGGGPRLPVPHPARWVCPQGVHPESWPISPARGRLEAVRAPDNQGAPERGARPGRGPAPRGCVRPEARVGAPPRGPRHSESPPTVLPRLAKNSPGILQTERMKSA